jgi:glycosyltransferase involved in cell wall biosynthesis
LTAGGQVPGQRVLFYPYDENPYQSLLLDELRRQDVDRRSRYLAWRRLPRFPPFADFAVALLVGKALRLKILHLHWPEVLSAPRWMPGSRTVTPMVRRRLIAAATLLGYQLTWTVHNLRPHSPRTNDDLGEAAWLIGRCSALFVHSDETASTVQELVPSGRVVVIPQGNYMDRYTLPSDRDDTRRRLGIEPGEFVALFFGKVRHYKGVADLLAAWSSCRLDRARLIVVGQCEEEALQQELQAAARSAPPDVRIELVLEFVPDEDVGMYFAVADVACLPFRDVTTSSSVMLALSLGVPVIVPRLPSLPGDVFEFSFGYDPRQEDGLKGALRAASEAGPTDLANRAERGLDYAAKSSWSVAAQRTLATYEALTAVRWSSPSGR